MPYPSSFRRFLAELWRASAPLTLVAFLMLIALAGTAIALPLDHRTITGMPAWIKPAKFAISTAIYSVSVAWLLRYTTVWPRFVRAMSWTLATGLLVEVGIIYLQAARGTTSHFNVARPVDAALFSIMGIFIGLLWLSSVGILIALFRQKFNRPAWGWALRLGMLITVLCSAAGGMMLRPTRAQLRVANESGTVTAVGGHTVGAPDGGPGLPVLGWSTEHGDLRISHFFGLHGLQVIPFFTWLLIRRRPEQKHVQGTAVIAASYALLVVILGWQALRGQSITQPDSVTASVAVVWLAASAIAIALTNTTARKIQIVPGFRAIN